MPASLLRIKPTDEELSKWGNKPVTGGSNYPVGWSCKPQIIDWFRFADSTSNGFPAIVTDKTDADGANNLLYSAHFVPSTNKFSLIENPQISVNTIINGNDTEFSKFLKDNKEFSYLKNLKAEIFKDTLNYWAFHEIFVNHTADKDFLAALCKELKDKEIFVSAEIALHVRTRYYGQSTLSEEFHKFLLWKLK